LFSVSGAEGKLIPAKIELVRLAIPRPVYTQSQVEYVLDVLEYFGNAE
jgi:tryptophanase